YDALRRAQQIIAGALEAEDVRAEEAAQHHNASDDRWDPIELPPVPEREERQVAEHHGTGPWGAEAEPDRIEVRFEMAHRDDAIAFAAELAEAGYVVHRRGSFLFLFADDHDSAHELGELLRGKAPANAQLYSFTTW